MKPLRTGRSGAPGIFFLAFSFAGLSAPLPGLAQTSSTQVAFTQILGQPTDHSITVSVRASSAVELYFEYGVASGAYTSQTKTVTLAPDTWAGGFFVAQPVLQSLSPDTRYYYRMEYRSAGSNAAFTPGNENTFHTQRQPGSMFVFAVQGDSHPERASSMFDPNLYTQTLTAVTAEQPDFYITSGDDFSVDTLKAPYTAASVTGRYTLQLPYFNILGRSAALFLVNGNHEEASLSNYNAPADANNNNMVPVWAQNARNLYYANPAPGDPVTGSFYTGNTTSLPNIGLLRDYYAWQWGDALFVTIDPYWSSPAQVDTGLGDDKGTGGGKTADQWQITHGDAQYQWLKQTLEQSKAKWKFVFAHHVMGTGRGGIETATGFEWGGNNKNGTYGFNTQRPTWPQTIHQLFVANKVTVFFQAHDHLFVHQQLDGVTYQELPNPADYTYTAFNSDAYLSGEQFPNAGYVKVTVSPAAVNVQYIREFLPKDASATQVSGSVQFAYSIPGPGTVIAAPAISTAFNAASGSPTIAPNTWIALQGSNLASAGDTRQWTKADFVNNQMPTQLDGVIVTVNGKKAYVYYISPTQVNVLTPPDALSGSVILQLSVNGLTSNTFSVPAQPQSPAFFLFNGGPYVVATHADGTLIGPATLYPGLSTPCQPGETIVLWANGFGPTSASVVRGSNSQSGTLSPLPLISIGGSPASVAFAGLVSPGLYQLNVVVPASVADGDQSVTASYSGLNTQPGALLSVRRPGNQP